MSISISIFTDLISHFQHECFENPLMYRETRKISSFSPMFLSSLEPLPRYQSLKVLQVLGCLEHNLINSNKTVPSASFLNQTFSRP